ncbi:MAG: hypothetical protein KKC79_21325, partial [Gammaproteobacteria bacterium]|nr:hypothetical protein [Gammaproteobacteria bacterium]
MSVVCASCHAVNRDSAMFCLGCAGKLPAFAATGPSALETVKTRSVGRRSRHQPIQAAPLPFEKPSVWLSTGLLVAIVLSAFAGWYVYVTRKVPSADAAAGVEQSAPRDTGRLRASSSSPMPTSGPGQKGPGSANVPLASSLSELESVVDAGAPPKATLVVPGGSSLDASTTGLTGSQSAAAS